MGEKHSIMLTSFTSFLKRIASQFRDILQNEGKIHLGALLILFLLGIAVRLHYLSEPILQDEAHTFVNYASKPLYTGLTDYSAPNNHLFHTFLVHIVYILLGNKPWMIRMPAFIAGILVLPASYVIIRKFYNKDAALLGTGIVAASAPLVRYSILARGYSLICLFFLLILGLATYLKRSTNSYAWLLFAILSALGFYTIPIMLYPFGIVVTWLLLSMVTEKASLERGRLVKNLFRSVAIAALLTVLLYLPVFVVSGVKSVVANQYVTRLSWSNFAGNFLPFAHIIWNDWNKDIPAVISILLIVGFFVSLIFHNRLSNYPVPIVLAAVIWLAPILLTQRVIPPERTWLFLIPIYAGIASSGLRYLLGRTVRMVSYGTPIFAVLAVVVSLCVTLKLLRTQYIYDPIGTVRDAEQISVFLKDYLKPGDVVLSPGASSLYIYYFTLHGVPLKYMEPDIEHGNRILFITSEYRQRAETALASLGTSVRERFKQFFPGFAEAKLIRQYQFASVYELDRIAPPDKDTTK